MSHDDASPHRVGPPIRIITAADLAALAGRAAAGERLRAHFNVHATLDANVQRLFIATEPGTYMRPHRHPEPHKWEFLVVLHGRIDLLVFSDTGVLRRRVPMSPDTTPAIEVPPGIFHAYVCMVPGTVALEVKEGAYIPTAEADFASWAPPELSPGAGAYLQWLRAAEPATS